MYFVWYDDNPKKTIGAKLDEAILRYKEHYGQNPKVCMLNDTVPMAAYENFAETAHVQVMPAKNVPQNYFWVGNAA